MSRSGTKAPRVAVVGAAGLVGREVLALLAERGHPPSRVVPLDRPGRAGREVAFGSETLRTAPWSRRLVRRAAAVVFAAGEDMAREEAPAAAACSFVVDTSPAFRRDPAVPLLVPELAGCSLPRGPGLVASPNCTAVLAALVLEPLRRAWPLSRALVATYQPLAGAGYRAVSYLAQETLRHLAAADPAPCAAPRPLAFNVATHESPVSPATGWNREEEETAAELRRLWRGGPPVFVTAVRVPVFRGHLQVWSLEFGAPVHPDAAHQALAAAPWLTVLPPQEPVQTARVERTDRILVGHVRQLGERWLGLVAAADTLRRGTARNVLGILEAALPL